MGSATATWQKYLAPRFSVGTLASSTKQLGVVVAVVTRAGITGRVNAGCATEYVDLETTVVGENPSLQMLGLLGGLQSGIGRKGIAVFRHVERVRKVLESLNLEAVGFEQGRQLAALMGVGRAND